MEPIVVARSRLSRKDRARTSLGIHLQSLRFLRWQARGVKGFVLCRPRGGFADSLAQITWCMLYARKFQRTLLIDGSRAGQLRQVEQYFTPRQWGLPVCILADKSREWEYLERLSHYPDGLSSSIFEHTSVYDPSVKLHVDPITRIPVRFDFVPYPHDLLIHEQCGGGTGWPGLQMFRLRDRAHDEIRQKLASLPGRFKALHIRNTDKRMDVIQFLQRITPLVADSPLLVCTDDAESIENCRRYLHDCDIFTLSYIPDSRGQSLHYNPAWAGWSLDVGILADLLAMSYAAELILPSKNGSLLSGFSQLAADLHRRPSLVRSLLSNAPFVKEP